MVIVKRLHLFILKTFLPLFAMTFFIVLFIVLMQFLWKYVDDLVGKGLELSVLAELFFYAGVSMVPMSLPLAILLASLMTFGNLGERLELTAMKASGISLVRVMAPLIIFIAGISVGAFFFQNEVLPKAQVKMWTLLFSMRQKSPELEIPEGVFYDQIPGYNLFISSKDRETKMLHNVMIYDVSRGGDNATILLSDSARLAFTKDMRNLYLHLWVGEQFENLRDQQNLDQNVPFRREEFAEKQVFIPFDNNFNRLDDQTMRQQYVGKNIAELRHTIDSVGRRVDSIGEGYANVLRSQKIGGVTPEIDNTTHRPLPYKAVTMPKKIPDLDSILDGLASVECERLLGQAVMAAANVKNDYEFKSAAMNDDRYSMRRHEIELIKKFTLSVACLVFFFIGAPLGAIIRKGGFGTPLVISVLLFLVYYIIDNTGYKMARDGHWNVFLGMWLSTLILAPLGIYVTIKAMNDSAVFNKDAYMRIIRRIFAIREKRNVAMREVILDELTPGAADSILSSLHAGAYNILRSFKNLPGYSAYFSGAVTVETLRKFSAALENGINTLGNSRDFKFIMLLSRYPVPEIPGLLNPTRWNPKLTATMKWCFPAGILLYLAAIFYILRLRRDMVSIMSTSTLASACLHREDEEVKSNKKFTDAFLLGEYILRKSYKPKISYSYYWKKEKGDTFDYLLIESTLATEALASAYYTDKISRSAFGKQPIYFSPFFSASGYSNRTRRILMLCYPIGALLWLASIITRTTYYLRLDRISSILTDRKK